VKGYRHKKNAGTIFRNKKKKVDTDPDWSGILNFNGITCYISLWENKKRSDGEEYFSVNVIRRSDRNNRGKREDSPY